MIRPIAKASLWAGPGKLLKQPELLFRWTQRPKHHLLNDYTSTRAMGDSLRILDSLPIIYRRSQIHIYIYIYMYNLFISLGSSWLSIIFTKQHV